jgi:hypothetical protein
VGRITFTQAMMADLEIRQGTRRGEVASRLLPDVSPGRARELLRQALVAHGMYQHNPAPNSRGPR